MPALKYRENVEDVKDKPVFGVDDLVKRGVPRDYAKTLLYRLNKRDEISRIERNKYTARENPMAVAPYLTHPSYLSLWTSLRFHNVTQQSPFTVEVVTSRSRYNREIDFKGTKIRFYEVKPKMMFGYAYEVYEKDRIPIASPEKALVDGMYLNVIPMEEVEAVVSGLDEKKLEDYAARAGAGVKSKIEEVRG
ncbi:hypothetical protein AKJ56_02080 [candidate division MSBL1 archaeon SCGC-AAA382N08]|uniref:AbiEi antitoxin C-terminal domain-containing protein n=1 Tax=candidate division MSBL1 archaeon SCGC-AAA382N08 TaxID=1698285 RepID=A0A133VND7_9EURY|nr:hypothetical protein AKJ56_02080 [candidate division MSBL1 archaeon SCGC-AAA382N08]